MIKNNNDVDVKVRLWFKILLLYGWNLSLVKIVEYGKNTGVEYIFGFIGLTLMTTLACLFRQRYTKDGIYQFFGMIKKDKTILSFTKVKYTTWKEEHVVVHHRFPFIGIEIGLSSTKGLPAFNRLLFSEFSRVIRIIYENALNMSEESKLLLIKYGRINEGIVNKPKNDTRR